MSYCSPDPNSFLNYIDEHKFFSCLTTFTFIVVGLFTFILNRYTFFDKRGIPQGAHPFAPYGNIHEVLEKDTTLYVYLWEYHNKFKRKGHKYGGLYLFLQPGVLIVDPKLMQKIISEENSLIDGSKRLSNYENILDLFKRKNMDQFFPKFSDIRDSLMENLEENGVTTALHNFFMETTCAIFGFESSVKILDTINAALKERNCSNFTYYFHLVYGIGKRTKSINELYILMQNTIEYRKKNDIREKDLIQLSIDLTNQGIYTLEEIIPELLDIFLDNIIYSYSTTLFCLYDLAYNERTQRKLIGEIRKFNKEYESINLDNLETLEYMDAVVKETLRKYPPVPMVIKQCKENYKVAEFDLDLPKGTFILASIFGVHYDPKNFENPEKFEPSRFSEPGIINAYFPFGTDLRKTIRFRFTCMHIKLALISILSSHEVHIDKTYVLEFDTAKVSVSPKEPIPFTLEPLGYS